MQFKNQGSILSLLNSLEIKEKKQKIVTNKRNVVFTVNGIYIHTQNQKNKTHQQPTNNKNLGKII